MNSLRKYVLFFSMVLVPSMFFAAAKNITDGTSCNLPTPQTMFLDRPQGLDSAVFFNPFYYECCDEHATTWYWFANYRYRGTWDGKYLAPCLFQSSKLVFAGSQAGNLDESELVADYIGMAPGTRTTLTVKPEIQNHIFDFFTRFDLCNLSDWFGNVWTAVGASLAYSNWDLHAHAVTKVTNDAFKNFPQTYMSCNSDAQSDGAAESLEKALSGTFMFGDMKTLWKNGKWATKEKDKEKFKSHGKVRLANIDVLLGDDIIRQPKFHVGAFLKTSIPTGNTPDPEYVFSPVVGNGHHWEFGGGLDAHWTFYAYDDQCWQLYATGSITHLFNNTQWRTFDFKTYPGDKDCYSGAFSRYILLKGFDDNLQYNGQLMNAINFTTRKITSSFPIQGDATLRLQWRNDHWAVGLGYNVFGRSAEKISGPYEKLDIVKDKKFGIKGTSGVCARGYSISEQQIIPDEQEILNATQSRTRMSNDAYNGINIQEQSLVDNAKAVNDIEKIPELPDLDIEFINWNSPVPPTDPQDDDALDSVSPAPGLPGPILVTDNDILFQGIPALITHKVFVNIDYQWKTCCHCFEPFIGIGASMEFGQRLGCSRLCEPQEECYACEPRFWSIWLQGGINF